MIVELQQQNRFEDYSVDIDKQNEEAHVIHRGYEIERKEIEPYPFSTNVKYLYTFQEVAFLIYKLSKMLKTKSKFMPKTQEVETKEERKLSFKELVRSRRKTTLFDLEKISSLQDVELNAARKRSLENINRWSLLKNKVTNPRLGSENEDVDKLKANILKEITIFLSKEVGSVTQVKEYNKHSCSSKQSKDDINKTLTNVVKAIDTKERDEKELFENQKKVKIQKKRHLDPLKETSILNIKKKDALSIFKKKQYF